MKAYNYPLTYTVCIMLRASFLSAMMNCEIYSLIWQQFVEGKEKKTERFSTYVNDNNDDKPIQVFLLNLYKSLLKSSRRWVAHVRVYISHN